MMSLEAALRCVQRRIRLEKALAWGSLGLALGAGLALGLRIAGFLWPLENLWILSGLCVLAAMLLGGLAGLVWPVSSRQAARRADACGLMARAQTALEWEKSRPEDLQNPMIALQRQDAQRALGTLSLREAMPLRPKKVCVAVASGLLAVTVGLGFVPNPQNRVLEAKAAFRQEMNKQAALMEDGAGKPDDANPKASQESRKILGELAQDLRKAESPREALTALDQAQRKLENLRQNDAQALRSALAAQGMEDLAAALEKAATDPKALEEALGHKEAQQLAQDLAQAAENAQSAAAQQALSQASQAAAAGNLSQAQMNLAAAATGSQLSGSQAAALLQMARNATARAGQAMMAAAPGSAAQGLMALGMQAGSGQQGGSGVGMSAAQDAGSGAGMGSTNTDAGYQSHSGNAPVQGNAPAKEKLGVYEAIYDPTRLGAEGQLTQERGEIGQGETSEAQLGPGLGSVQESVPYSQVALEYQLSAVQAVENADLPTYAQKWVESYFASLLE